MGLNKVFIQLSEPKAGARAARVYSKTAEVRVGPFFRRSMNADALRRLGVGASVPETVHSVTREAARLRGKLVGGKRQRGEDTAEPSSKPETDDDDDGESRVKAIRKKVKLDPFAATHGKKKSTGLNIALQKKAVDQPPMPSSVHSIVSNNDETDSPSKKRKKKKKLRDDEAVDEPSSEGLRLAVGSPPHTAEKSAGSAVHIQKHSGDSIEHSAHATTVKKQGKSCQTEEFVADAKLITRFSHGKSKSSGENAYRQRLSNAVASENDSS